VPGAVMRMRRLAVVVAALAAGAGLVGCGNPNPTAEVRLRMDEFSLRMSPGASDEGLIKIFVDNVGELEHGLVFVRAKTVDELPLAPDGSVDLAKVQVADQLKPIEPGKYRIAPDLFPGPLVVLCNLVTDGVSHFQRGMATRFQVRDVGD
jgi:hypothetical protein